MIMEISSYWERVKKYKWHLIAAATVLVMLIIILSVTSLPTHQGKFFMNFFFNFWNCLLDAANAQLYGKKSYKMAKICFEK